jgi:predicted ATPase
VRRAARGDVPRLCRGQSTRQSILRLLQTAAGIGKDVPLVLLHTVAEAAEEAVQRELTHLQAAEFLYETRLFPDPEYTFKHALTHEVTYGTLLQDRRKALHARIVGAIEHCYPDRLTEHVERLAHHAVRARCGGRQ